MIALDSIKIGHRFRREMGEVAARARNIEAIGQLHPIVFYDFVERLCPAPLYGYLFSRYRHNEKWDCHGDEAPDEGGAS
jgi:N6-adenosine-specific RNA methylase IME4